MGGVSQGRGLRGRGLLWAGPPQSLPQVVRALRGGGGCGGCTGTEVSGDPFSRRGEAGREGGSRAREKGLHTLSQEARPGRRRESMCACARECRRASGGGVGVGATSRQERPLKEYSISVSLPG